MVFRFCKRNTRKTRARGIILTKPTRSSLHTGLLGQPGRGVESLDEWKAMSIWLARQLRQDRTEARSLVGWRGFVRRAMKRATRPPADPEAVEGVKVD